MYKVEIYQSKQEGGSEKIAEMQTTSVKMALNFLKKYLPSFYCIEPTLEDMQERPQVPVPHLMFYGKRSDKPPIDAIVSFSGGSEYYARNFYRLATA